MLAVIIHPQGAFRQQTGASFAGRSGGAEPPGTPTFDSTSYLFDSTAWTFDQA